MPLVLYFWTHTSTYWFLLLDVLASVTQKSKCMDPPVQGWFQVTGNDWKLRAKSLIGPPSVLNLTLITVDVDLSVCAGQTLWGGWYSITRAHFGICFSSLGHLVPIFRRVWTKLWPGMWIIIQCTYLASRVLKTVNTEICSSWAR